MKRSQKIALGGVVSALSLVILMAAYLPTMTYALPAISGALIMILVTEIGYRWALSAYAVVSLLGLFLCEKEATVFFTLFFGIYPILKSLFEKFCWRWLEYLIKLLYFNVAIIGAYLLTIWIFRIGIDDFGALGQWGPPLLLLLGNIVFFIYDIALTKLISWYMIKLHDRIRHIIQ